MKGILSVILLLTLLLLDQALKIWVKTNMYSGQEFKIIFDWFRIHFVENNGMAFGLEFGGQSGKTFLSLFRIIASGFMFYILFSVIRRNASWGLIIALILITAGAVGNILDCAFYGLLFSESPEYHRTIATFMPAEGGYASLLHGKVVDMLHFPIYHNYLPDWLPFWGGRYFVFFSPIFNLADAFIFLGVCTILFFQKEFFKETAQIENTVYNKASNTNSASSIVDHTQAE